MLEKSNAKWVEVYFYWDAWNKTQKLLFTPLLPAHLAVHLSAGAVANVSKIQIMFDHFPLHPPLLLSPNHFHLHLCSISFFNKCSSVSSFAIRVILKKGKSDHASSLLNTPINEFPNDLRVNSKLHIKIVYLASVSILDFLLLFPAKNVLCFSPSGLFFYSFSIQSPFWPWGLQCFA